MISISARVRGTSPPNSAISFSRQRDDVLRLVAIEPDGLDVVAHLVLAEREHLLRRIGDREQRARRAVDAGVGRLRRQHHRDQQRVGVEMLQFALRLGIGVAKAAEGLVHLGRRPGLWFWLISSRLRLLGGGLGGLFAAALPLSSAGLNAGFFDALWRG